MTSAKRRSNMAPHNQDSESEEPRDEFVVEPWTVRRFHEQLTLADETPRGDYFGSAAVGFVIAGIFAWTSRWFGWFGYLLGLLLLGKAIEFVYRGLRAAPSLLLDRTSQQVLRNGRNLGKLQDVTAVEMERTVWPRDAMNREQEEFRVTVRVRNQVLRMGTFGAKAAAERLAEAIADFLEIPVTRR